MKILHISDTHTYHHQLNIPQNIDVIAHTGDATNEFTEFKNATELYNFLSWFSSIDCKYKIFVAGNHDSKIYNAGRKTAKKMFEEYGIIYLEQEDVVIDGIKFYGEPHTPIFGNWYFMRDRSKMHKLWEHAPEDMDVLLTHGPAYGIMDVVESRLHSNFNLCGDKSLRKFIDSGNWKNLKVLCHGHIHSKKLINPPMVVNYKNIQISNAAAVEDSAFDKGIIHHGNLINI